MYLPSGGDGMPSLFKSSYGIGRLVGQIEEEMVGDKFPEKI